MSILLDNTVSSYINKNFSGIMVFCQVFQIRLYTDEGYEWYILDYDKESSSAIGMVNQNDRKNAIISVINVGLLNSKKDVKIDYDYIPEQINALHNRLKFH